jgi:CBS domain containing-hemolysin-like protein
MNNMLKHSIRWSIFISIVTLILASVFSVVSTAMLQGVSWAVGILVVLVIVLIGIVFDMMGIASASASETPFHAMAAKKVPGAREAISIVRNADRFSNFCNDVVGDICGIISGTASALVVANMLANVPEGKGLLTAAVTVVFSGVVSALTVGGKALGKSFSIHYSIQIVLWIGKFFSVLERRLGLRVWSGKKKNNGKRGNRRAARSGPTP